MSDSDLRLKERAAKAEGTLEAALLSMRARCGVGDHTIAEMGSDLPQDWAATLAIRLGYKGWSAYLKAHYCAVCPLERRTLTMLWWEPRLKGAVLVPCPHDDGGDAGPCGAVGDEPCKTWRGDTFRDGFRHPEREAPKPHRSRLPCRHAYGNGGRCEAADNEPCRTWRGQMFRDGHRHAERDVRSGSEGMVQREPDKRLQIEWDV